MSVECISDCGWPRYDALVVLACEADDIRIWRALLDEPVFDFSQLACLLSGDEQRRAEGLHFERDRRRFIIRRGILRILLGCYLNTNPVQVEFGSNRNGKPSIIRPSAGNALSFSVSDSDGLALYGFSRGRAIGVDVERVRPLPAAGEIAERFFSESEKTCFRQLPESEKPLGFFICWTRKEAYLKATGRGLFGDMKEISVSLGPKEPATLSAIDGDPSGPSQWFTSDLAPAPGYVAAICMEVRAHGLPM